LRDPISKKKTHHKKRAGGVAQGIGPEFKPQHQKLKKKEGAKIGVWPPQTKKHRELKEAEGPFLSLQREPGPTESREKTSLLSSVPEFVLLVWATLGTFITFMLMLPMGGTEFPMQTDC
jgi:hypothetical protein